MDIKLFKHEKLSEKYIKITLSDTESVFNIAYRNSVDVWKIREDWIRHMGEIFDNEIWNKSILVE